MKAFNLFIFSSIGSFFILLLFYATLNKDSSWATVAITGILVIITAYYAISTEKILRVNAQYAWTTEKILEVNRKNLELLNIERRSSKIEEITRTILIPLDGRIKNIKERINDKTNVSILDPTKNRIKIHSLNNDIRFSTTLDFINSQFETIKIDKNYSDPIFQEYVRSILGYIEEYDKEQNEYENFLNTNITPFFQKIVFPFIEKMKINYNAMTPPDYNLLFSSLMVGKIDSSMKIESANLVDQSKIFKEYSHFIDVCWQNNIEFRTFIEKKAEYEEKLINKLELLSTELDSLLSEWMNVYHIVLSSIP